MGDSADRRPPFIVVAPPVPRHPVKQESLRSSLRRQLARYSRWTWILLVVAAALAAMFWRVAEVWLPTVITAVSSGTGLVQGSGASDAALTSSYNNVLAIWTGKAIEIYDLRAGRAVADIPYLQKAQAILFSRNGRCLLTQDQQRVIRLFDVSTGVQRFVLKDGGWPDARSAVLSPDGSRLGVNNSTTDGALWDCTRGRKIASERMGFMPMAFTPDGRYFAAVTFSGGLHVRRWNARDGTLASDVPMPDAQPGEYPEFNGNSLVFSPDASRVAYYDYLANNAIQVHLIDAGSGAELIKPARIAKGGQYLQFTPDGKLLHAFGYCDSNGSTVAVDSIDLATGQVTARPPDHIGLSFLESPDSRLVVGSVLSDTLILDSRTLRTVARLPGQPVPFSTPFSPDSRRVVVRERGTEEYGIYDTHTWSRISAMPADDVVAGPIMLADGSMLGQLADHRVVSWTHHRPDAWWGVGVLWEFWAALGAVVLFVISARGDVRRQNPAAVPARRDGAGAWWEGSC
jgi:WD40 repeat protein